MVLRPVAPAGDARRLAERAGGGVFAIARGLTSSLPFLELTVTEGGPTIIDRSAELAPPWDSFQGSSAAGVYAARVGSEHLYVLVENRKGGQIQTAHSSDDGATWTMGWSTNTECGNHDPGLTAAGGRFAMIRHEACTSGGPHVLEYWDAATQRWIDSGTIAATYTDTVCATNAAAVWLTSRFDSDRGFSRYTVSVSTDLTDWAPVGLPAHLATEDRLASAQNTIDCDDDGFSVVAAHSDRLVLFDATGSTFREVVAPNGFTGTFNSTTLSHGTVLFNSDDGDLFVLDATSGAWRQLIVGEHREDRLLEAAVDGDGNVWAIIDGQIWSSAVPEPDYDASSPEATALALVRSGSTGDADAFARIVDPEPLYPISMADFARYDAVRTHGCDGSDAYHTCYLAHPDDGYASLEIVLRRSANGVDWSVVDVIMT